MDENKEVERPELATWMFRRDKKPADLAQVLNKAPVTVARYLLPFDHPQYRRPTPEDMELILVWTEGLITAEHYYPRKLRRPLTVVAAPTEAQP